MSEPRQNGKNKPPNLTTTEALEILLSAVQYCQGAGLTVRAGNSPMLTIQIDNAVLDGTGKFSLEELPSVTPTGPRSRL